MDKAGTVEQSVNRLHRRRYVREADLRKQFGESFLGEDLRGLPGARQHAFVDFPYGGGLGLLGGEELLDALEPETAREPLQRLFFIRDRVGLQFHLHLQPVLDVAQKPVGASQRGGFRLAEKLVLGEQRQRAQRVAFPERGISCPAQNLE